MPKKQGIKDKIGQMTMEKPEINKKILVVKRSFDEMSSIFNGDKKK